MSKPGISFFTTVYKGFVLRACGDNTWCLEMCLYRLSPDLGCTPFMTILRPKAAVDGTE